MPQLKKTWSQVKPGKRFVVRLDGVDTYSANDDAEEERGEDNEERFHNLALVLRDDAEGNEDAVGDEGRA